jgi:lysozyme
MTPPKVSEKVIRDLLAEIALPSSTEPVALLGVRGYRRDSMGVPGQNDVGIYDDAIFLVGPNVFLSVNANTDPVKLGWNSGVGKPFAMLQEGLWYFRRGPHRGKTPALRQATDEEAKPLNIPHNGEFLVERSFGKDNPKNYKEWGYFAINMHSGGENSTSSWGCQTIPPDEFLHFMDTVWKTSINAKQNRIPYFLMNGPIV